MEYTVDEVYGLSRNIPLNYVERHDVDERLRCNLNRDKHITIFGSSKQGKTCLRKHCLNKNDYILVQCSNRWSLSDLNAKVIAALQKAESYIVHLKEQHRQHLLETANSQ